MSKETLTKPYPPTPELNKMKAVQVKSQAIGEFLDLFCREKGYVLCVLSGDRYFLVGKSIEKLLAEHFEIDLKKVEQERRAILDHIRGDQ